MRLFGVIDNTVDRYDRAGTLTCPFDLAWAVPVVLVLNAVHSRASIESRYNGETALQGRYFGKAESRSRYRAGAHVEVCA